MVENEILLKNFNECSPKQNFLDFHHRNQELKYVTHRLPGRFVVGWLAVPIAYVLPVLVECQDCTLKIDDDYILQNLSQLIV